MVKKQGIANRTDSFQISLLSYFPFVYNLWLKIKMWHKLSYASLIIMNFSEDWDVGIFYLFTKFELDRFINNGDLLSDRYHWKHTDIQINVTSKWTGKIKYQDNRTCDHTDLLSFLMSDFNVWKSGRSFGSSDQHRLIRAASSSLGQSNSSMVGRRNGLIPFVTFS